MSGKNFLYTVSFSWIINSSVAVKGCPKGRKDLGCCVEKSLLLCGAKHKFNFFLSLLKLLQPFSLDVNYAFKVKVNNNDKIKCSFVVSGRLFMLEDINQCIVGKFFSFQYFI